MHEAEGFRRFEPENIFKIKKKRDTFHNRVSGNKRTTYIHLLEGPAQAS